jgi:hypothetical protein
MIRYGHIILANRIEWFIMSVPIIAGNLLSCYFFPRSNTLTGIKTVISPKDSQAMTPTASTIDCVHTFPQPTQHTSA